MNAKKAANIMSVLLAILLSSCQPRVQTGVKTAVVEKPTATPLPRISEYGRYQGYSEAIYSGVVESSQYIPVRDGTLLAADIYRPAVDGQAVETPLPVIHPKPGRQFPRDREEYRRKNRGLEKPRRGRRPRNKEATPLPPRPETRKDSKGVAFVIS